VDCITEKVAAGMGKPEAVNHSQYPRASIVIVKHEQLCTRHLVRRYPKKGEKAD